MREQSKAAEGSETPSACEVCNDMSMVKLRMTAAGAAMGPPPQDAEREQMRHASQSRLSPEPRCEA